MNVIPKSRSRWLQLLVAVLFAGVSVTQASLFASNEPIAQLQLHNFSSVIHNSSKMWIVDFYASWCGYCQRLAPEYSSMAKSIQGWSDVVGVAAVDCADSTNSPLCRNYGVSGYPTVKFFQPNADASFKGIRYDGDKNKTGLLAAILGFLHRFINDRKPHQSWPTFDYIRYPQSLRSGRTQDVYIVVEDRPMAVAYVGITVILDSLNLRPKAVVGRMNLSDAEFSGVRAPGLYQLTSFGALRQMTGKTDRQTISQLIKLQEQGKRLDLTVMTTPFHSSPRPFIYRPPHGLHMQDLESNLYYSFWVEIPSKEAFDEEALQALKEYVQILDKYYPGERHVKEFIDRVSRWLSRHVGPLTARSWLQKLNSFQSSDAYIRESSRWTGCNGSQPQFRGYPCSLWMMFHAITVDAYVSESKNASFDPRAVLLPIRGYVKIFFSCRPCAANFFRHAQHLEETDFVSRDVVLWLWRCHNQVNSRLHGDLTEDPMHPKVQFPAYEACFNCRISSAAGVRFEMASDMWDEDAVLAYLLRYYGRSSILDDDIEGFSTGPDSGKKSPSYLLGTGALVTHRPSVTTPVSCSPMATDWTPCSQTCDAGTSMRMTMNSSTGCQLQPEVRLCLTRPCTTQFPNWSESRLHIANCPRHGHTYRLVKDIALSYGNCSTAAEFWRVCGKCPPIRSRPICCRPSRSTTQPRQVTCAARDANGRINSVTGTMMVEVIDYCRCDENCSG